MGDDTALHLACHFDRPHLVERLMRYGCNVNARGRNGHSALHMTAELGSMKCATTLLESDNQGDHAINPNVRDLQKQTPLHIAAWHGRVELCSLLVGRGAEVDPLD